MTMNQILGGLGICSANCYGWHTWSLWEQYNSSMPIIYENRQATKYERRQRRHCIVCNKEQDEWIKNGTNVITGTGGKPE